MPYVALTVYSALVSYGGLTAENAASKKVLVLGGSGGVGTFAIQILKAWGAEVATTCSKGAMDWLKQLTNVDRMIDYNSNELDAISNEFDLLLDAAKAQDPLLHVSAMKTLKRGGRYVTLNLPFAQNIDRRGFLIGMAANIKDVMCSKRTGSREGDCCTLVCHGLADVLIMRYTIVYSTTLMRLKLPALP